MRRPLSRRRPRDPDVTVCVAAFEAAAFVEETLTAVAGQTHDRIRVLVSVDASTDGTESVCRRFERDERMNVVAQPRRLGWVGNINFLLDRVETPFFLILPHDDLLDEAYVDTLRDEALRNPDSINAYCDVETYGLRTDLRRVCGLDGPLLARTLELISARVQAPPFRGLTRSVALERGLRLRDNGFGGYGAHNLWVLQLACLGPLRRVPHPLYRRHSRESPAAVTQGWRRYSPDERLAAWVEHCFACLQALASAEASEEERLSLVAAQLTRAIERAPAAQRAGISKEERRRAQHAVLAGLFARALRDEGVAAALVRHVREDEALWSAVDGLHAD